MFFGRIGANYMSRRYFTYTNDQSVPGQVLFDATLGARVHRCRASARWRCSSTPPTCSTRSTSSTIGSNGFGNSGDNQTLLAGAPQQFFVTVKTAF